MAEENSSIEKLAEMIALIDKKEISNNAGKTVLDEIIFSDKTPAQVLSEGKREMVSGRNAFPPFLQGASGFVFHYVQENGGNNQPCGA